MLLTRAASLRRERLFFMTLLDRVAARAPRAEREAVDRVASAPAVPSRLRYLLLPLCVALTLVLGAFKLSHQREHPPQWARNDANSYAGYVAIDGYARRAETLRDVVRSGGSVDALLDVFRADHHANVVVTPVLVAFVSLAPGLDGAIVPAFALVAFVALLVSALAVLGIARELETGFSSRDRGREQVAWIAVVLFLSHVLVARTALQLQLDGVHAALVALATLVSLRASRTQRFAGAGVLLALIHTLGLLNKYAYLPALAIPLVVEVVAGSRNLGRALVLALACAAPAILALGFWVRTVAGPEGTVGDFQHLASVWTLDGKQVLHFAIEMLLLLQIWPLVLWMSRGERSAKERAMVACLVLLVVSVCVFRLPAVPRLYLPAVAPLAALAAAFVARRWDLARVRRGFYALVALNYAAAVAGVFVGG